MMSTRYMFLDKFMIQQFTIKLKSVFYLGVCGVQSFTAALELSKAIL